MLPAPLAIDPSLLPIVVLMVEVICVRLEVDAGDRRVAAVGHPEAAKADREPRAWTLAGRDRRGDRVRLRVEPRDAIFRLVRDPHGRAGSGPSGPTRSGTEAAIQSGAPGTGNTASGFKRSIGILTPAVFTPGLGGGGASWADISTVRKPAASTAMGIFGIVVVHNNRS